MTKPPKQTRPKGRAPAAPAPREPLAGLDVPPALAFVRLGNGNPEPVHNAYVQMMIETRKPAFWAQSKFGIPVRAPQNGHSHHRRRADGPLWCFTRFGRTVTQLPDGRILWIGGEHEDWYDENFCIYNDVVVENTDGSLEVCFYAEDAFPPTDFHTATLAGDALILIGSLGYGDRRRIGETQVLRLDLGNLSITALATRGDEPGWIHRHQAEYDRRAHAVTIWGGTLIEHGPNGQVSVPNTGEFTLDLATQTWRRVG